MVIVDDYFEVKYGVNLELVDLEQDENGIGFVSRIPNNNGVSAKVKLIDSIDPNPPNTISVSCGGTVMESFLQKEPYYSGRDICILIPKQEFTDFELLYYCMCLRANKYRYNYGRQANQTLKYISIPSKDEIPDWVYNTPLPSSPTNQPINQKSLSLDTKKWKTFKYGGEEGIFTIKNGYYNKKPEHTEEGNIPFIGAAGNNNGITEYYSTSDIENANKDEKSKSHTLDEKIFKGNCVTVVNNGASVGCAFYQETAFTGSHDINILYLKNREWNKYIAMFVCAIIPLEKYRWTYGRKWRPVRMRDSEIKLPVNINGEIDWDFMENFIKTLSYSKCLEQVTEVNDVNEITESVPQSHRLQRTLVDFN